MKNRYLTKQQRRDIAISILYDWSKGGKAYPQTSDIVMRLSNDFMRSFEYFNTYKIVTMIRDMMYDVQKHYMLVFYRNITPVHVQLYANKQNLHISSMKVTI